MNYKLAIKLNSIPGCVRVQDANGKSYWAIPEEGAGLVVAQSVYLPLVAWESRNSYYGDSHFLKIDYKKDEHPETEPIVGNMRVIAPAGNTTDVQIKEI